jgi:restriction system protein
MKRYYRLMLGQASVHAARCRAEGFVGAGFGINQDLSAKLPDDWRSFNKEFAPIFLATHPGKSRISAGLACGAIWTVSKGMQRGDIILSPNGAGSYFVGTIDGDYHYAAGDILPHRRAVLWSNSTIARADMSDALKGSTGSIGTIGDITAHAEEIERLITGIAPPQLISTDPTVENVATFALEKHLEDFLVANWAQSQLGKDFEIFSEDGAKVGQQYPTDTGPIDILAVSKDGKRLLVVELKRGRASDVVVGQILRYMGFVRDEIAEASQSVEGIIIALEDSQSMRRAIAMVPSITFYRYEVSFKLIKG